MIMINVRTWNSDDKLWVSRYYYLIDFICFIIIMKRSMNGNVLWNLFENWKTFSWKGITLNYLHQTLHKLYRIHSSAPTADLGRIVLIGVLSTLGIIVLLLILLAAAYFWWRHKRSQLEFVEPTDENETSSGSLKFQQLLETQQQEQLLLEQQKQLQQQQQAGPQPNNINRKLNGFLNLKTPLIG